MVQRSWVRWSSPSLWQWLRRGMWMKPARWVAIQVGCPCPSDSVIAHTLTCVPLWFGMQCQAISWRRLAARSHSPLCSMSVATHGASSCCTHPRCALCVCVFCVGVWVCGLCVYFVCVLCVLCKFTNM